MPRIERNVAATMRDGTRLLADIHWPDNSKPAPVILQRTAYNKSNYATLGEMLAQRGFVTIFQDVRGQFASEGQFTPWTNEGRDGFDTIAWAANLEGVNGKVGTFGGSYSGYCQWQAALEQPPHLRAMAPHVAPVDLYDQWVFPGGAFALSMMKSWLLHDVAATAVMRLADGEKLRQEMLAAYEALPDKHYSSLPLDQFAPLHPDRAEVAGYFFDWVRSHSRRDGYWQGLSLRGRHREIAIPVLNMGGWYDVFIPGTIEHFCAMQAGAGSRVAREHSRLVIGPWAHLDWGTKLGELDFGPQAKSPYLDEICRWFGHWLKDEDTGPAEPAVRYFVMGRNEWASSSTWPPPEARLLNLYLARSGGTGVLQRNSPEPDGKDLFVYDPDNPVPSIGGHGCCFAPVSPFGPYDQSRLYTRHDILTYTTPTLEVPLLLIGPVEAKLQVSSSAPETDFTAKLIDVHPDGRCLNIGEGIRRVRFSENANPRHAHGPTRGHEVTISLQPTAIEIGLGHALRLEVSSSNFPLYDANPNTGEAFGTTARTVPARQTVYLGGTYGSRLSITVG